MRVGLFSECASLVEEDPFVGASVQFEVPNDTLLEAGWPETGDEFLMEVVASIDTGEINVVPPDQPVLILDPAPTPYELPVCLLTPATMPPVSKSTLTMAKFLPSTELVVSLDARAVGAVTTDSMSGGATTELDVPWGTAAGRHRVDVRDPGSALLASCVATVSDEPLRASCSDVTRATDPGSCSVQVASIDAGSGDPNGDPVTIDQEPPGPYGLGSTNVVLTLRDGEGNEASCAGTVTVIDETSPSGTITSPRDGTCFQAPASVSIEDNFRDNCPGDLVRAYSPAPGPPYSAPGSYEVELTVTDGSGNPAQDTVHFTIDGAAPVITILAPRPRTLIFPGALPMSLLFSVNEDAAARRDVIYLQDRPGGRYCALYDGATYGDGDGVLTDETLFLSRGEICRLSRLCSFTELREPEIKIESTDCAGNTGSAAVRLTGRMVVGLNLCGQ